ncbi:ATP-dependent helicase RecQ [Tolypothrix sp. PCC 7601]|nr:ATP-dependent helicase RecQ [Tolypothrix sp. PCC 7601]
MFRFINPGLLRSFESFNQRFAIPIEKFQDKQVHNKLKKLIQPFLLDRLKNQVLEKLPSCTEGINYQYLDSSTPAAGLLSPFFALLVSLAEVFELLQFRFCQHQQLIHSKLVRNSIVG